MLAGDEFKTENMKLLYIAGFEPLELAAVGEKEPGNISRFRKGLDELVDNRFIKGH